MTPDRYYSLIRGQIEHQDNLIGQRLSWFVGAQAFLFTAYAISVGNAGPNHPAWLSDRLVLLVFLIPITAILTCILIYLTVVGGLIAIWDLRRLYHAYADREATTGFPPIQGTRSTQILGRAAPLFVPVVFFLVWLILLVQKAP